MPLADLDVLLDETAVPGDVRSFLHEAERRVERFQHSRCIPGFVPCDFGRTYGVLRDLAAADLAPGRLFCEWGSGFGVVACLAAMLDFDAWGIEIEGELVDAARQLAEDFGLPVEFVHGSFIPPGGSVHVESAAGFVWLSTEEDDTPEGLGLDTDDLDVVFAYPWPDEERVLRDLFERYAAVGAVLVTYHGGAEFRLRRKTRKATR
jgi:hypothetical protein